MVVLAIMLQDVCVVDPSSGIDLFVEEIGGIKFCGSVGFF